MIDRTTPPDAPPAGGPQAADEITPAVLGRVLAEAGSIQDMSPDGGPVWFKAQMIAERAGMDVMQVSRALLDLQIRGDIVLALHRPKGETKFSLSCALAEAFDNGSQAADEITSAVLEQVRNEIRAIQATSPDGGPVWFHCRSLFDRSALPSHQVAEALKRLRVSGELLSEFCSPYRNRARREFVLAEACDSETLQALKDRDWRHPVYAREAFEE